MYPTLTKLLAVVLISVCCIESLHARAQYLQWWSDDFYPDSSSDELACQMCHQNVTGGDGWNQYGWAIRERPRQGEQFNFNELRTALRQVESDTNPDAGMNPEMNYLDEIRYNTQPGWVTGSNNTIYFSNSTSSNNAPPVVANPQITDIDFNPVEVTNPVPAAIATGAIMLELNEVEDGFVGPVKMVTAPGIQASVFVVEQRGTIQKVDLQTGQKSLFIDLQSQIVTLNGGYDERGLLGLAFHPNFASNGRLYTFQSEVVTATPADFSTIPDVSPPVIADHRSVIREHRVRDAFCDSTLIAGRVLLTVDQPQSNHNGGDLAFGPDGYLYISLGDGGGADDQGNGNSPAPTRDGHGLLGNGRDNANPLGSILRIDVDGSDSSNGNYGLPGDNPFISGPGLDEIFAYGFRNPFRISFDSQTGDLYTGDVGQEDLEEVDKVVSGGNYGWNIKEGSFFFIDFFNTSGRYVSSASNPPPGIPNALIDPVVEYDRDEGISVTGGYVYRGSKIPALSGNYVFADYFGAAGGSVHKLRYFDAGSNSPVLLKAQMLDAQAMPTDIDGNVTGFGQDSEGELYVITNPNFSPLSTDGKLLKIQSPGATYTPPVPSAQEIAECPIDDEMCFPLVMKDNSASLICL